MELRALDTTNLDKYWLCNHCLPTTKIYKITTSDGNTNATAPIRHLKRKHKVDYKEKEDETNGRSSPTSVTIPSLFRTTVDTRAYGRLCTVEISRRETKSSGLVAVRVNGIKENIASARWNA